MEENLDNKKPNDNTKIPGDSEESNADCKKSSGEFNNGIKFKINEQQNWPTDIDQDIKEVQTTIQHFNKTGDVYIADWPSKTKNYLLKADVENQVKSSWNEDIYSNFCKFVLLILLGLATTLFLGLNYRCVSSLDNVYFEKQIEVNKTCCKPSTYNSTICNEKLQEIKYEEFGICNQIYDPNFVESTLVLTIVAPILLSVLIQEINICYTFKLHSKQASLLKIFYHTISVLVFLGLISDLTFRNHTGLFYKTGLVSDIGTPATVAFFLFL